jgi:lauroyl/myristoyl acyltransferase
MDDDDLVADFNVRPLVESLKKNEIIMILGDALHSVNFAHIKILEQVYPFPTGFMTIAMNTGATILPTFAVDDFGGYGIKIVIEKPLELEKNGATNQELTTINIEHYVRIFESYVKRYPHLFKIWTKENWFEKRRARSRKDLSKRY